MDVLDPLERTPDTEAQWLQLADAALAAVAAAPPERGGALLQMAERCCAAVGNLARAGYLRRVSAQHAAGLAGDALAAVRAEVRRCVPLRALFLFLSPHCLGCRCTASLALDESAGRLWALLAC